MSPCVAHFVVGVVQKRTFEKLSKPFVVQPSLVCIPRPSVHAAGTAGLAPNQAERSLCRLDASECSIHIYEQFGLRESTCIMVVSAHPVTPSSGTTDAIG